MTTGNGVTLIVGGHGKTGRRVAERLVARGVPIRMGSRSGEPPFDWNEPHTWAPALRGARAAYVTYYPDLAVPGAAEAVGQLARLAVEMNVRRLVLLSGRGEEGARLGEEAVRESGADWTIIRSSWFSQNFSEGAFLDQVRQGEVAAPVGDVREPFVDADDIADVAAAALTEHGHTGQLYEVTGPRLLTFADAIGEISTAARRDVRYVQVSLDEYASLLAGYGVPADLVSLLRYLFTEVLDGRNADVTDGIDRALGRRPRDFADFARAAASAGAWQP